MFGEFRPRTLRRGELLHVTIESAFLTSGTLLSTILVLLIFLMGVLLCGAPAAWRNLQP